MRGQYTGASQDRAEDTAEADGWIDSLVVPQDGGDAGPEQVDRATSVGANALETAPAGSLHGQQ